MVGIVASRLSGEVYLPPPFMVCLDQGMGKGSCRSWGGINLFPASGPVRRSAGGALGAMLWRRASPCGRRGSRSCLPGCSALVLEERQGEEPATVLEADAAVLPQELTVEAVEQLDWLGPCGTGNPRPVLVLTGAHCSAPLRWAGAGI